MGLRFSWFVFVLGLSLSLPAWTQAVSQQKAPATMPPVTKVPSGVILVKGAWSSASDSVTPVPEGGKVADGIFSDKYFGMTYTLPAGWTEKYKGPPPSDSGLYVLAQLRPTDTFTGAQGNILISAQDMFFTPLPASNARELIHYTKDNLQTGYEVEIAPTETSIAGQSFVLFEYWSPIAQLHWYILTTQIRCHAIEIVLTSRDTKLLESLVAGMQKMKLPVEADPTGGAGGGAFPVCIQDYARDQAILARVNPVFAEPRSNAVPVRIIIDKEGNVKHIHFLSAFPDQAKVITDALRQWKFKRYLRNGHPMEVETGILFGRAARLSPPPGGRNHP
jgi:hypothetical protein